MFEWAKYRTGKGAIKIHTQHWNTKIRQPDLFDWAFLAKV